MENMRPLFIKYLQDHCTSRELEEVIGFLQKEKNDPVIDNVLYEKWITEIRNEGDKHADPQVLNSIHHRIALKERVSDRLIRNYQRLLGVAAIFIVALVTGALLYMGSQDEKTAMHRISTPYGAKTQITLPDGTDVWLNSGSTLTYPDRFRGDRLVELTGEAYFEVVPGRKPFFVASGYGAIRVLGTRFNVKAYDGEDFVTTLEDGSVQFTDLQDRKIVLKPGEQVIYDMREMKSGKVETEIFTSWKDGRLIFRNEPLQNMITRLERWYNVDIELKGEQLKNLKYNGTIEMETFSEVLELIKVTTPIHYTFDRNTRILAIFADN